MPEDNNQVNDPNVVNVDKIVKNALGDRPFEIKQAFDNEMLNRVSQVIAGKREAVHKGMFGDQEMGAEVETDEDDILNQELTDDEIEDALNDEAPEEEQEEETPEEEPEEDLRAEFEATLEPDSEEEPEEEKNETS